MKQHCRLKCLAIGAGCLFAAGAAAWRGTSFLWSAVKKRDQMQYTSRAKIELLTMWLRAGDGGSLERYLLNRGVRRIAVYGYNDMGDLIYRCLKGSSIELAYAIDAHGNDKQSWLDILTLQDELPPVDLVIVAPLSDLGNTRETLKEKLSCEVVELSQLVHYL